MSEATTKGELTDIKPVSDTTKAQQKRTSKACLACRARKSKCTLDAADGTPQPPCQRCKREGKECVIGTSNRGGRRVRRSTVSQNAPSSPTGTANAAIQGPHTWSVESASPVLNHHGSNSNGGQATIMDFAAPQAPMEQSTNNDMAMQIDPVLNTAPSTHLTAPHQADKRDPSRSSSDDNIPFNDLQNPSDALDILAHIASNDGSAQRQAAWSISQNPHHRTLPSPAKHDANWSSELDYHLVHIQALSPMRISQLLQRYYYYYHPYFPIVPMESLDPNHLRRVAREEKHLLTAMLVISSKDLIDEPHIFRACSEYMQKLVSNLAAGGPSGIEAVEALLLLAEWTPYTSKSEAGQVGRGEEDREAWMHVGNALRIGYFLGLDRYSFRMLDSAKDSQAQRKRLVWTACYISDRQISIRIGRGFWSRGPGPMTTLRKEDFPSLQAHAVGEEDYASIFQATLELTMLFSNVHDVLYSNPSGFRSHLSGGYIKFIDDFRSAIYGWNSVYGTLTCSQNLKATLLMSYDYLRLYTNAFAFHATIQRALPKTADGKPSFSRVFYNNVGAVGDARFIYEGLDAAKSLLTTMNNFVDAENSLRYMPLRFYLYTIYAGVFLYRARTVGVMSPEEDFSVRRMIQQTVGKLEQASVSDHHPGGRYSQLLKLLWEKVDRKSRKEATSVATLENPYRPGSTNIQTPGAASSATQESEAVTEQMGGFSWTDLDAIGNFALNGNNGGMANEADWWTGFLPADNNPFGGPTGIDTMGEWALGL